MCSDNTKKMDHKVNTQAQLGWQYHASIFRDISYYSRRQHTEIQNRTVSGKSFYGSESTFCLSEQTLYPRRID